MLEDMRKGRRRRITVGADKAYDTKDFHRGHTRLERHPRM